MYKILIVDDDDFIRNAIVELLNWEELGFSDVFEAEDGEIALEVALENRPDVILTDIRMPFMDGLQLSQTITSILPQTKIIILTGHDEFEYAKEAIKIGVTDYIIKPIRKDDLSKVISDLKYSLDSEKEKRQMQTKLKRQLRQSLPLLKEKFLNSLINGFIPENEFEKRLEYLEINLKSSLYIVCTIEPDTSLSISSASHVEDNEIFKMSILNIINNNVQSSGIAFNNFDNGQVLIYFSDNPSTIRKDLHLLLFSIQEEIKVTLKKTITIGIGSIINSIEDLKSSYKDALNVLEHKIDIGINQILDFSVLGYRETKTYYPIEQINALLTSVRTDTNPKEKILELFEDIQKNKDISIENLKVIVNEIITSIEKLLFSIDTDKSEHQTFDIYSLASKIDTIQTAKNILTEYIGIISKTLHYNNKSKKLLLVENAKQFILNNYFNPKLSLNLVSSEVYVSPSYLSMLFKKETGKSFVDFLTRIRMEKAMELLRINTLKTYEIAEKTGYSDSHYFSISFKKYSGRTPSEFRGMNEDNKKN